MTELQKLQPEKCMQAEKTSQKAFGGWHGPAELKKLKRAEPPQLAWRLADYSESSIVRKRAEAICA